MVHQFFRGVSGQGWWCGRSQAESEAKLEFVLELINRNRLRDIKSLFSIPFITINDSAAVPYPGSQEQYVGHLERLQRRSVKIIGYLISMTYHERLKELGLLSPQRRKRKGHMTAIMKYTEAFPKKKGIGIFSGPWWTGRGVKEIYVRYWENVSHGKLNKTVAFIAWLAMIAVSTMDSFKVDRHLSGMTVPLILNWGSFCKIYYI